MAEGAPLMDVRERWLSVGRAADPHAQTAGATAVAEAVDGREPQLLMVFCSDSYDLAELLGAVNERAGGAPVIGCSTAGEIATDGPDDASVVVVALGGPGFSIQTACATGASDSLREAGAEAAKCFAELDDRPYKILLLLTDGLAGDQQEIVRGAHGVVGAGVPLVGGSAGDDLKMTATWQLYGDRVLQNSVVAAALGSDAPLGIGVRHGWRRVGEPMLVTRSTENRVQALDDQPALDVYFDRLGAPVDARTDPAAFTRFALTHPLGLDRRTGEDQVRTAVGADFDDRELLCVAEVPQGGLAWFMEGDDDSVLQATDAACNDALAGLDGHGPLGLVAFDCIARRGVLGDVGIKDEVERVARLGGGAPVAGFYTYGEIARTHGVSGFHNQTLVVLAVG